MEGFFLVFQEIHQAKFLGIVQVFEEMAIQALHRKEDEKDEMAYQDENIDMAKQPVQNAQVPVDSAMTRRILLKLDVR